MDEEVEEHLRVLHESARDLNETVGFMMSMDQRTLLILARMAFILERVANEVYKLEKQPFEDDRELVGKFLEEIRGYFDEQTEIMKARREGTDG